MNGAHSLLRTLVANDVDVCFTNPGTSEMHFVAALDGEPGMRAVLGLFEGVVTGAADGYARMAGSPPRRCCTSGPASATASPTSTTPAAGTAPLVNVVGDHATYHQAARRARSRADIETLAANVSGWIRRPASTAELGADAAAAVVAARTHPGAIATLILPADVSWTDGGVAVGAAGRPRTARGRTPTPSPSRPRRSAVRRAGGAARRRRHRPRRGDAPARRRRSPPRPARRCSPRCSRTPPAWCRHPAGASGSGTSPSSPPRSSPASATSCSSAPPAPVSFFAYPGRPSDLVPDGCEVHVLTEVRPNPVRARDRRTSPTRWASTAADAAPAAGARPGPADRRPDRPDARRGGRRGPARGRDRRRRGADRRASGRRRRPPGAPPHDWLTLTGGSIGFGMPVATGAAIACPDRPVVNLQADGSAMYTLQSLWTQAREGLDVTTRDPRQPLLRDPQPRAGTASASRRRVRWRRSMLDLTRPDLDFVALARGMGVPAERPDDGEALTVALAARHRRARPAPRRGRDPVRLLIRAAQPPRSSLGSIPRYSSRLRCRCTIRHSSPDSARCVNPGWCNPRWTRPSASTSWLTTIPKSVSPGATLDPHRRRARGPGRTTLEDEDVHAALVRRRARTGPSPPAAGPGTRRSSRSGRGCTAACSGSASVVSSDRFTPAAAAVCRTASASTSRRSGPGARGDRARPARSSRLPMRVPMTVDERVVDLLVGRPVAQAGACHAVGLLELAVPAPQPLRAS